MKESHISKTAVCQLALIALLTTLTACGGSGGSTTPPAPPPPTNAAILPITADNAQDIAESVFNAISSSTDLISIADVIGLPIAGGAAPGVAKLIARDITVQTAPCDTGETRVTWDDADNDLQVSTGDTFVSEFDMCFLADPGVTIDGISTIDNLVVTGDPVNQVAPWSLAATFGFADLVATGTVDTVTINGDLDVNMSSDDNLVINASVGSALLTVDVDGVNESVSDYLVAQVIDVNALTQVISADGTFTSDILQGSVTFETLQEFLVMGDDNPSSGQMLISDSTSSVLVTVLDNLNVQLDIDLNLDGTIDETIVVTWAELDAG